MRASRVKRSKKISQTIATETDQKEDIESYLWNFIKNLDKPWRANQPTVKLEIGQQENSSQ